MYKLYQNSYSQAGQESFVLSVLEEKRSGFYLEIGAFDGKELSNTFLLETEFQWKGIALEIQKKRAKMYNRTRSNPCYAQDALTTNYSHMLDINKAPQVIDFLQIDIEPAANSLKCLKLIPFENYRFNVITFEHDYYSHPNNQQVKDEAYNFLNHLGYSRVVDNVCNKGNPFEDWYVHNDLLQDKMILSNLKNLEWTSLFR